MFIYTYSKYTHRDLLWNSFSFFLIHFTQCKIFQASFFISMTMAYSSCKSTIQHLKILKYNISCQEVKIRDVHFTHSLKELSND